MRKNTTKHFFFSLCTMTLITPLLFSKIVLEESMSKQTQKKTGIDQLTTEQKKALESWLNDNFQVKSTESMLKDYEPTYLSQNISNGHKLELSDGSKWEVAPDDVIKASYWLVPFPMRMIDNENPDDKEEYPKVIINETTGVRVKVKMIEGPTIVE